MDSAEGSGPIAPGAEVTVECNPDDLTPELARSYAAGGVTRLSIGVQSLVPEVLVNGKEYAVVRPRPTYEEMIGADRVPEWLAGSAGSGL